MIIHQQQFSMIPAMIFSKEIPKEFYFHKEADFTPLGFQFLEKRTGNLCTPRVYQYFDRYAFPCLTCKNITKAFTNIPTPEFIGFDANAFPCS